jgi:hypothetical protein
MLSAKQRAAAIRAANKHLDGLAIVSRETSTETSTGESESATVVYTNLPCNLTLETEKPVAREGEGTDDLNIRAYVWLPTEWADAPLVILRDDIITINGLAWRATAPAEQMTGFETRKRVRVHRSNG